MLMRNYSSTFRKYLFEPSFFLMVKINFYFCFHFSKIHRKCKIERPHNNWRRSWDASICCSFVSAFIPLQLFRKLKLIFYLYYRFKNRPKMTFDDAAAPADQEFSLVQDPSGTTEYATK